MRAMLVLLAGVVCLGCAAGGGRGIKYPKGWPIKALTVPEGAQQTACGKVNKEDKEPRLTWDGIQFAEGKGSWVDSTMWGVAFNYSGTPEEVVAHVESVLKGEGFRIAPPLSQLENLISYWTPDGMTHVDLFLGRPSSGKVEPNTKSLRRYKLLIHKMQQRPVGFDPEEMTPIL